MQIVTATFFFNKYILNITQQSINYKLPNITAATSHFINFDKLYIDMRISSDRF